MKVISTLSHCKESFLQNLSFPFFETQGSLEGGVVGSLFAKD